MQTNLHPLGEKVAQLYASGLSQKSIGKQLNISEDMSRKIMHLCQIPVRSNREQALKYHCNDHYFDVIDTEEKAYWLGFMYADGFIQSARKNSNRKVGLSLMESDWLHLEKFKTAIEYTGPVKHYEVKSSGYVLGSLYCRILVSSPVMANALICKGCLEHKTGRLSFPGNDILPSSLVIPFIRGYFDGNGSIIKHSAYKAGQNVDNWSVDFVASKELLAGIGAILNVSHLKHTKRHADADPNTFSFRIGGNKNAFFILDKLYSGSAIHLDRKYQCYLDSKQEYLTQLSRARQ